MNIQIRKAELNEAVEDFYNITKIHIMVVDCEFQQISSLSLPECFCSYIQQHGCEEKCKQSDNELLRRCAEQRKPQRHTCHAGLLDYALPIIYEGNILGYIIMGRVRTNAAFEKIYQLVAQNEIEKETLNQLYDSIILYDDTQIKSAANLALMLITYILSRDMLKPAQDLFAQHVREYITQNLSEDLSVNRLCKEMGVSKNILYKYFRENFNCCVNEYVTKCRLEEAKRLLTHTTDPISVICDRSGIRNYSYFCRLFKEKNGLTPLQYRRTH